MGCFNRNGFISHLPISYGDDIVLFLLADTTRIDKIHSIPCYPNSVGYTPLCLPFFGKYDDYGCIENVINNFNSWYFENKVGMPINEVCNLLLNQNEIPISLNTISSRLEELRDPSNDEYKKEDKIRDFEIIKTIYEKIFGLYDINGNIDNRAKFHLNRINNASITFTIEHRYIYDKMVEIGAKTYEKDNEYLYNDDYNYTLEEKFEHTNNIIKYIPNDTKSYNPFTLGSLPFSIISLSEVMAACGNKQVDLDKKFEIEKELLDKMYIADYWFSYSTTLHSGSFDFFDYRLYNRCYEDISGMKEDAINYVYFLHMMHITSNVFTLSSSHNQSIEYDKIISLYKEMLNLIQSKKEKYYNE